jgi:hypothetical protein
MTHPDELVLRTLVFQFDGRVVEIFGGPNNDVIRYHVALLKEPQIGAPNRNGRSLVRIGSSPFTMRCSSSGRSSAGSAKQLAPRRDLDVFPAFGSAGRAADCPRAGRARHGIACQTAAEGSQHGCRFTFVKCLRLHG